jgi:hypothetical protein
MLWFIALPVFITLVVSVVRLAVLWSRRLAALLLWLPLAALLW